MMRPSGAMTSVCGIAFRPFISVTAVSRSAQPRRKPKLKSRANRLTRSDDVCGSSVVRPMNSTPRPANSLRTFSYSGISLRHGPHHVAQRLTTTILPLKSARLKVPDMLSHPARANLRADFIATEFCARYNVHGGVHCLVKQCTETRDHKLGAEKQSAAILGWF